MTSDEKRPKSKKSYEPPVLRVYGDIKTVTGTLSDTMMGEDGGSGKFSKTL
jgi:hypothetical protein